MLVLSKYCVKWKWKPCCSHATLLLSSFAWEMVDVSISRTGVRQHCWESLCTVVAARGNFNCYSIVVLLFHFVPFLNFYPICDSSNNDQWETK